MTVMVASLWSLVSSPSLFAADKVKALDSVGDWQNYFNQGVSYGRQGDWDKAIDSLKMAADLQPGKNEIYTNLSLAYAEKKDFDNAVANA